MKEGVKKRRAVYCAREEWAWVSAQASASGMGIGDYLAHCGLNMEIPEGGVEKPANEPVLSPDEQRQLLGQVNELSRLSKTQFGRDRPSDPDMLGMVRICFEVARTDYLDKYGSFAFDELMEEVERGVGDSTP